MYNTTTGRDTFSARTERSTRRASAVSLRLRLLRPMARLSASGVEPPRSTLHDRRSFFLRLCPLRVLGSVLCYSIFPPPCATLRVVHQRRYAFCQWLFLVLTSANNGLLFATFLNGGSVSFSCLPLIFSDLLLASIDSAIVH